MGDDIKSKVDRLIRDFYPWGDDGYLPGPPPKTPKDRRARVEAWLRTDLCAPFATTATALIARVAAVLRDVEAQTHRSESPRLLARIDASSLVKTPASILEKMVRSWNPESPQKSPINFPNLAAEVEDLGRFRIVANFLSDVETIAKALERPYGASKGRLTPAQKALKQEFTLKDSCFRDLVHLEPGRRDKGERCRKGAFYPTHDSFRHVRIEIQIQTLLQEAWDKKDHFLIYEPRRRGKPVEPRHSMEIFAMSELLYVADLTFDRLRQDVLQQRKR